MNADDVARRLLDSTEPAIRWKIRVNVLGEDPDSGPARALREEIPASSVAGTLLQHQGADGRLDHTRNVYSKWQGAHWIMAALADIGYPPGGEELVPIRDQLQEKWLAAHFYKEFDAKSKAAAYGRTGVPVMQGRCRRCASQQANALWSILKLGVDNDRTDAFVERLLHWQWPDGGWNCDKNPSARHSSYMESILPLRALSLYAALKDHQQAKHAALRAAEIFLKRRLYLRQSDGKPIKADFTHLHYPLYWHYDILHGLKIMAETGFITDPRCEPALDLLESKRLPDGGWPAEQKYYRASDEIKNGNDHVDWGGTSKKKMNEWVTADALHVLKAAGRIYITPSARRAPSSAAS